MPSPAASAALRSTPARPAVSPDHHELQQLRAEVMRLGGENMQLRTDLTSARLRERRLLRALNDRAPVGAPLLTARRVALVGKLLDAARVAQEHGEVPVIQFARDLDGATIIGIHLMLLDRDDAGGAPLAPNPVEFGGMAVLG